MRSIRKLANDEFVALLVVVAAIMVGMAAFGYFVKAHAQVEGVKHMGTFENPLNGDQVFHTTSIGFSVNS